MREIVFDTETTGMSYDNDRLVEIGAVEIVNLLPTGKTFHTYINPEMEVSKGAERVHGLSTKFLKRKPTLDKVIDKFLAFIGQDQIVAHNAEFDVRMINADLARLGRPALRNKVVNTLPLAREVKRGGKHNLDALCTHYGIDNSNRDYHGALLDSELLAAVYLELRGGRQYALTLARQSEQKKAARAVVYDIKPYRSLLSDDEREAHRSFVATLGDKAIWSNYLAA